MLKNQNTWLALLGMSLAVLAPIGWPVVAQVQRTQTNPTRQTLASLPNGNYFYGTSQKPYQSGANYLMFQKSGTKVTGVKYPVPGEMTCFQGTVNSNTITKVMIRLEAGLGSETGEFLARDPIALLSYSPIRFNQGPVFARKELQHCLQVFSGRGR